MVNLSVLGDGIIVLGLGAFLFSLSSIYVIQAFTTSAQGIAVIIGFFLLSSAIVIGGALKIAHAFRLSVDDKSSSLKTPAAVAAIAFVIFYVQFFFFAFRL